MLQRAAALLLVGFLAAPPARAKDEPEARPQTLSIAAAADRVVEAHKASDQDTLAALAARRGPDPWTVADVLCSRGEHDAAHAVALAGLRPATKGLPGYIASRRGKADDAAAREALQAALVAIRGRDIKEAFEAIKDFEGDGQTVTGIAILFHKGLCFRPMRRLQESSALSLRAAAAAERWGWIRMAMRAYDSAGIVHRVLKNPRQAIDYYRRALGIAEVLRERLPIATQAQNLAYVHYEESDHADALVNFRRALDIFEKLGREREMANALNNIGRIQTNLGDYGQALAHHERALRLQRKLGNLSRVAGEEINLGLVHASLADYTKALAYYERGLRDAEKAGHKQWQFNALNNTAALYWELGDPIKAREFAERALDVMKDAGRQIDMSSVIIGLGMIHARLKDYERAWQYYEKGLSQARTLGQRRHVTNALGNMGRLHLRLGEYERATARYEEALAIAKDVGDRVKMAHYSASLAYVAVNQGDREAGIKRLRAAIREARRLRARPLLSWALPLLAEAYLLEKEPERALYVSLEALREVEHLLGGLGEEAAASVRARHAKVYAVGTLAAARSEEPAEVVTFLESGRAGSLLEALGGRKALRWTDLSAGLRHAEREAKRDQDAAYAAYRNAVAQGDFAAQRAAAQTLDDAELRVSEVAARIRREAKGRASGFFYPRAATLEEVQGALGKGQAMVLYGLCLDEALALVLTRDRERLVPLGSTADIAAACDAVAASDRNADPSAALARIGELLVRPLALEKDVEDVIVSPEGPICYVPFGALFDKPVTMTPSGTTHALLMRREGVEGKLVLALGDPEYGSAARPESAVYARGRTLRALPFTRAEAESVGDYVLLGAKATETGLRALLAKNERWRSVHLACHGLVDPEKPTLSSLALSREEGEDGFLTALEVLRMDIPTDLAVLSACETGKGKVVKGEGILGLTRAFMYAGAPRVLCSLWKVDDEATQALMVKFYELWNPKKGKGIGAAEALRQAQGFVRGHEKWKHPYFWAAWVLWGLPE